MNIEDLQEGMIVDHPEPPQSHQDMPESEVPTNRFVPMKVRVVRTSPLTVDGEQWTQVECVHDASPQHPKPGVTFGRPNGTDIVVIGQV